MNVPTTVFTPLEYGSCGYPEEEAIEKFGEANIEVYHSNFQPLEYTVAGRSENDCYAKIICNKADDVSSRIVLSCQCFCDSIEQLFVIDTGSFRSISFSRLRFSRQFFSVSRNEQN